MKKSWLFGLLALIAAFVLYPSVDSYLRSETKYTTWSTEGSSALSNNSFDVAIKCFDKALEIKPSSTYDLIAKGQALMGLNRFEEAITYFDKAIEIDPKEGYAWNHKGDALDVLRQYQDSMRCYDTAAEVGSPHDFNGLVKKNAEYGKSRILEHIREQAKYEEEIKNYDKELEENPSNLLSWLSKGDTLLRLGRYYDAINSYDKAIELDPTFPDSYESKGYAFTKLLRYEDAVEFYDKAINLEPRAGLWASKGEALKALGRNIESNEAFAKAKKLGWKEN